MGLSWSTLFALAVLAGAWWAFHPPSAPTPPRRPSAPLYTSPGPVLATKVERLTLDGLTILPVTRLPRLKTRIAVPLTSCSFLLAVDLTASETVCRRLRVDSATVKARDVLRSPVSIEATGVEADLQTSAGVRFEVALDREDEGQQRRRRVWSWRTVSSGRVDVALGEGALEAKGQVVRGLSPGAKEAVDDAAGETAISPQVALLHSSLSPGHISRLILSTSFAPFLPKFASAYLFGTLVPSLRNFSLVHGLTSKLVSFLLQDLLESHVTNELLADLSRFLVKHVDGDLYSGIADDERDALLADFFSSASSSSSAPAKVFLGFSSLLHGPTLLVDFPLPTPPSTALPIFSRGRGLRHKVLSSPLLNQVTTGPPSVELGASSFERVGFSSARVELAPPSDDSPEEERGARDLVLSVTALDAVLRTAFSLRSELRTAPSLLFGGEKELLTPGSVTASVSSSPTAPLKIHLPLLFSPFSDEGWKVAVLGRPAPSIGAKEGGLRLEGDFTKVAPRVAMESRIFGRLGERVVNAVLETVETLIAPAAAPLASYFLADLARQRLQQALDDVCARVRDEGGVEWTRPAVEGATERVVAEREEKE
ncbi:hypothetical protein JCM8097_005018 [Rhodosporidiobolus ruineniae]